MKSKAAVCVVMALSMASSGLAFGQGRGNSERHGDRNDGGRNEQAQRGGDNRGGDNERSHFNRSGHDERGFGRGHNEEKRHGRGAGPNHEYYRGDRLPAEYRHRQYVVNDWRGYNLTAPPRGYQWVQSGSDFILVTIATGVILQLLLGR
ncbi:MAG: RcnB family protein [Proteobacteria bacterium]|nr:RcnB family protein [Pseudomonadota bacterium]